MVDATHPVAFEGGVKPVPVPTLGDQKLVVPNAHALVFEMPDRGRVLLQKRDKPGEDVRGRWELPGGKWQPGERLEDVIRREVAEETGLEVEWIDVDESSHEAFPGRPFSAVSGALVTVGHGGAYPALLVCAPCGARGTPVAQAGETAEPTWVAIDTIARWIESEPQSFTGPTLAALRVLLAR